MSIAAPSYWDHPADYPQVMREHAQMLAALDAPFYAMQKEKAESRERERASASANAGLVPIKNKGNAQEQRPKGVLERAAVPCTAAEAARVVPVSTVMCRTPGAVQIEPHARRCKRMRVSVEHSMRLAESGLVRKGGFFFRRWLVTLTYAEADGWAAGDVGAFVRIVRQWCKRRKVDCKFVWVAELQERGAVHYHLVFWMPKRFQFPKPDAKGWWPHGMSNRKVVKGGCSGVMGYLSKYMSKTGPKEAMGLPRGARMFGAGGLDREERREIRYRLAPYWIQDALGTYADIRRTLGGWVDRITGLFVASPWKVEVDAAGLIWAYRVA